MQGVGQLEVSGFYDGGFWLGGGNIYPLFSNWDRRRIFPKLSIESGIIPPLDT